MHNGNEDAVEEQPRGTLQELANAIALHFEELEGRVIAVSEIEPFDQTNVPTLPLCAVALLTESGSQNENGGGRIGLSDDVLVYFMFKAERYKKKDGGNTPFYAYYDYETVRDKLLGLTKSWHSSRGGALSYTSLEMDSDEYAVYLSFRFNIITKAWCDPAEQQAAMIIQPGAIKTRLTMPPGKQTNEEL